MENGLGIPRAEAGYRRNPAVINMDNDNRARLRVSALIYCMVNAVIFGVGVISILSIPALARYSLLLMPAAVVASLAIAAPLAWFIAPWMMMRFSKANSAHWNR